MYPLHHVYIKYIHYTSFVKYQYDSTAKTYKNLAISNATIFTILIIGLIAGPAVSL